MTGDGRPDKVVARFGVGAGDNAAGTWTVMRSNGAGFDPPVLMPFRDTPRHPYGATMQALQQVFNFRLNKIRHFAEDLTEKFFHGNTNLTAGMVDLNNDGLLDLVTTLQDLSAEHAFFPGDEVSWFVFYNQGDDFSEAIEWQFEGGWTGTGCNVVGWAPVLSSTVYYDDPTSDLVHPGYTREIMGLHDVNGDGLLDFVYVEPYSGEAGTGDDGACNYLPSDQITSNSSAEWIAMTDPFSLNSPLLVRLNTGTSFAPPRPWLNETFGVPMGGALMDNHQKGQGRKLPATLARTVTSPGDINHDGIPELAVLHGRNVGAFTPAYDLYKLREGHPDRLRAMTRPEGGRTEIAYAFRRQSTGTMGPGRWVVDQVTHRDIDATRTEDGSDVAARVTYRYEDGLFDREERKFMGFGAIYEYGEGDAGYTLSRYMQKPGFEGLRYCREVRRNTGEESSASLVSRTQETHQNRGFDAPAFFVTPNKPRAPVRAAPRDDGGGVPAVPASARAPSTAPADEDPDDPYDGTEDGVLVFETAPEGTSSLDSAPRDSFGGGSDNYPFPVAPNVPNHDPYEPFVPEVGPLTCARPDDPGIAVQQEFAVWIELSGEAELYTPRLAEQRVVTYNADASSSRTVEQYWHYDQLGNPYEHIDAGDVTLSDDDVTTVTQYAQASIKWIGVPCHRTRIDAAGATLSEEWLAYDGGAPGGCETPSTGLVTQIRKSQDEIADVLETRTFTREGLVASLTVGDETTTYAYSPQYPWLLVGESVSAKSLTHASDPTRPSTYVTTPVTLAKSYAYYTGVDPGQEHAFGLPMSGTDENGQITSYTYDSQRRPSTVTRPKVGAALPLVRFSYQTSTPPHAVVEETLVTLLGGEKWRVKTSYVDGFGRTYGVETPAPANDVGATKVVTEDLRFDASGRVKARYLPYFDVDGRSETLKVASAYDLLGRLTRSTWPSGGRTTLTYNHLGRTALDPVGHLRYEEFDARGKPSLDVDYSAPSQPYRTRAQRYTPLGDTREIVDDAGNVWSFTYDRVSGLTRAWDPDTGRVTHDYDASGRRFRSFSGALRVGAPAVGHFADELQYDDAGRVVRKEQWTDPYFLATVIDPGSPTVTPVVLAGTRQAISLFYCDQHPASLPDGTLTCMNGDSSPVGRLSRVEHYQRAGSSGIVLASMREYCYDARGRVAASNHTVDGTTYRFTYLYNQADQLVGQGYPDGDIVLSTYDAAGSLATKISAHSGMLVDRSVYNAQGLPVRRELGGGGVHQHACYGVGASGVLALRRMVSGNGNVEVHCGDFLGGTEADSVSVQGGGILYHDVAYGTDVEGFVVNKVERYADPTAPMSVIAHEASYDYDAQRRLTLETYDGQPKSFTYDELDNMLTLDGVRSCYGRSSCTIGSDISGPHQLNSTRRGDIVGYGAIGQVKSWRSPTTEYAYEYNPNGSLYRLWAAGVPVATYLRDAEGALVAKVGATTAHHPGHGYRVNDVTGVASTELHYDGSAVKVTDGARQLFFKLAGADDSAAVLVDAASGLTVQVQTFAPYGEARDVYRSGAYATDYGFNGKRRDATDYAANDEVYDFGPRSYAASLGRWLYPDSSFVDGSNRYAFVRNSPSRLHAVSGKCGGALLDAIPLCQFGAGFLDEVTFRASAWWREDIGGMNYADPGSVGYSVGSWTGFGASVVAGGAGQKASIVIGEELFESVLFYEQDAYAARRGRGVGGGGAQSKGIAQEGLRAAGVLLHHMYSHYGSRGARLKEAFFGPAGLKIKTSGENIVGVPFHVGPHSEKYHELLEDYLINSTYLRGIGQNHPQFSSAVKTVLQEVKTLFRDPNNPWLRAMVQERDRPPRTPVGKVEIPVETVPIEVLE